MATVVARVRGSAAAVAALAWLAACGGGPNAALRAPTPQILDAQAPDSFVVEMQTSEGTMQMTMHREWSPEGVDRVYHLMSNDFYAGARVYRMLPGFVAQWGYSGDPALDSVWQEHTLPDEPSVGSNGRGTVSFARAGPESRSYQLFINLGDNSRLDDMMSGGVEGYPPVGVLREGDAAIADGFYPAYGERARQDSIAELGNEYLRRAFPQMDSIIGTRVIREWP